MLCLLQVYAGVSFCLVMAVLGLKPVWGVSVVLGCLVFVLPNLYFGYYFFRFSNPKWVVWMLRSIYWGQASKMLLTGLGVVLSWRFAANLHLGVFAVAYAVVWLAHTVAAARMALKPDGFHLMKP